MSFSYGIYLCRIEACEIEIVRRRLLGPRRCRFSVDLILGGAEYMRDDASTKGVWSAMEAGEQ